MLPLNSVKLPSYELGMNRKPNLKYLKDFGCIAYANIHKTKLRKLDNRAKICLFVRYDSRSKTHRIFIYYLRVSMARSVKFVENNICSSNSTANPDIR